jgi:F0F1-type ATP synthase beta subunit
MSVNHSYSNPIWSSKWNIKDLYIGSANTTFATLFRDDQLIREIMDDDVDNALEFITSLGEPLHKSDKEAYEETKEILDFLKKYTSSKDFIAIIKDES